MLRRAETLRVLLERQRRARGSIDFDLPAPTILLDVEGVMTGIKVEPRNRAHRMIEEFMLAANEPSRRGCPPTKVPCLFRVHEAPDPEKVETTHETSPAPSV
jgi:ribonuclease R